MIVSFSTADSFSSTANLLRAIIASLSSVMSSEAHASIEISLFLAGSAISV